MPDLSKPLPLYVAYGDCYLDWKLGAGIVSHPTNPVRAQLAVEKLTERLGESVVVIDPSVGLAKDAAKLELAKVHSGKHIHAVVENYVDDQWGEPDRAVAMAGLAMFSGTVQAAEALLAGEARVAFNPQGAKHHAQRDHSSGFCVFNDMAWAALTFQEEGFRPLYLDWDIHAGDGVYELLSETDIPTLSIHNGAIYPGNSKMQDMARSRMGEDYALRRPEEHAYNWNLNQTAGDDEFKWAIDEAAQVIDRYAPNVILLAAGADGHEGENNLGLRNRYSYAGFDYAADVVAALAEKHNAKVLIGGAGGYQPFDHTPEIWARVVERIYTRLAA